MTEAAKGLHMKPYREYGADYLGTDEYYDRINNRMRQVFPDAFTSEKALRPRSVGSAPITC